MFLKNITEGAVFAVTAEGLARLDSGDTILTESCLNAEILVEAGFLAHVDEQVITEQIEQPEEVVEQEVKDEQKGTVVHVIVDEQPTPKKSKATSAKGKNSKTKKK